MIACTGFELSSLKGGYEAGLSSISSSDCLVTLNKSKRMCVIFAGALAASVSSFTIRARVSKFLIFNFF